MIALQDRRITLRTYRQVWHLEQVIYQIERVRLPFPVTFRQAGIFGLSLLVMAVLSRVPPVSSLSPVLRYLLVPGLLAWYLTNHRLDGKLPHRWALSMLRYWLSPWRLNRFRPINGTKRLRLVAHVSYRIREG